MADDLSVLYTDKKVQSLEKKLKGVYKEAQKDIEKKTQDFFEKAAKKEQDMLEKVANGSITQDEFDKWKKGKVFAGENWKAQQESIAKVLSNSNSIATAMINGEKADVFAFAGNYTAYDIERGFGVNFGFDLYNEKAVERLIKDNPKILPKEFLKKTKDEKWNMRNVRSQITQGIIQGESIPKIAKRLAEAVPNRNEKQMVLHARTAMTSAQNGGKMQRFKDAEDLGIKFRKVWVATLDSRTRDTHQELDGQAVKPDEPFEVQGMKIMFPGDPDADASLTFNCRCTMVTELDDYPSSFDRRAYDEYEDEDGGYHRDSYITEKTTYQEWVAGKRQTGNVTENIAKQVERTQSGSEYGKEYTLPIFGKNGEYSEMTYNISKEKDYKFPDGTHGGVHQVRDADVYTLSNGTKFIQPSDLDTKLQAGSAEFFMERYAQLPEDFRDQIQKTVVIVDYRNPQDSQWAKRYKMKNFRSYATGGRDITFYAYPEHDPEYVVQTFAHEGGHYIDLYKVNAERVSESSKWAKAMRDDLKVSGKKGVSSYAQAHKHEDFAESIGVYMTEREKMKDFPNRAKIIKELIGDV